jgi:hypothetical protein
LLNLRTEGQITVCHSRAEYLDLEDIQNFELGADALWDSLAQLNMKERNTFKMGNTNQKFQLIHPVSADGEEEETMGLGREDEVLIEEGNIETLDEDEDYSEQETENKNLVGHRYNLRSRKLNINQTTFDHNKPQLISILKKVNKFEQKQNLEILRMADKNQFYANKKAFIIHTSNCVTEGCQECIFFKQVKGFIFQQNSLLNYEIGNINFSDTKLQKTVKKLRFINGPNKEIKKRKLIVNWTSIQLSSWFCTSLIEYTLICSEAIYSSSDLRK